ncbi:MFS transporter [Chloroflexota bacterium]
MTNPFAKKLAANPLLLQIYAPSFLTSFSRGLLIPILPLYLRDLGASYVMIGLVMAAQELGTLLADIPAGVLLRRLGRKYAMLLGLAAFVVATTLLFAAGSVVLAMALRFLAGLGIALFNVSRHQYLAEMVKQETRGRTIAGFGGINRIGVFLGPAVGGAVATAFGLRTPFLLFGITGGLALTLVLLFVRRTRLAIPAGKGRHALLTTLKEYYRLLSVAGVAQLFMQTIRAGRGVIIPLIGADLLGLDVAAIGAILSAAAAIDMTLFIPAGWLMDRFGRKYAIVPSVLIQALGMALLPLVAGFGGLLLVSCLLGFGNGLGAGTMMTLGADLSPDHARSEFLGAWRFIGDSGGMLGPVIVGGVADLLVLSAAALGLAACGLIAGLVFARWVPEPLKPKL